MTWQPPRTFDSGNVCPNCKQAVKDGPGLGYICLRCWVRLDDFAVQLARLRSRT